MKIVSFTESEMEFIRLHGQTCEAVARAAMERSGLSFDDVERINDHYESHRWGSNADRRYRKAAVNRAVKKVAANPLEYAK